MATQHGTWALTGGHLCSRCGENWRASPTCDCACTRAADQQADSAHRRALRAETRLIQLAYKHLHESWQRGVITLDDMHERQIAAQAIHDRNKRLMHDVFNAGGTA